MNEIMNYIKIYIKMHIRYGLCYLFTLITMSVAWGFGVMLVIYFAFTDKNVEMAEILARMLFAVIGSFPLIIPNYKASKEMNKYGNKRGYLYFMINQVSSIIGYYIFYSVYIRLYF